MSLLNKTVTFETMVPVQVIGEVVSEGDNGILVRMTSIAPMDKHTWIGAAHVPQVREVPEEDADSPTVVGSQPADGGTLADQPVASGGDSESPS